MTPDDAPHQPKLLSAEELEHIEIELVFTDDKAHDVVLALLGHIAALEAENERLRARIAAADALADRSRQLADEVVACYAGHSDWGKLQHAWDVWEVADAAYRSGAPAGVAADAVALLEKTERLLQYAICDMRRVHQLEWTRLIRELRDALEEHGVDLEQHDVETTRELRERDAPDR